jgi:hypothetical protein
MVRDGQEGCSSVFQHSFLLNISRAFPSFPYTFQSLVQLSEDILKIGSHQVTEMVMLLFEIVSIMHTGL